MKYFATLLLFLLPLTAQAENKAGGSCFPWRSGVEKKIEELRAQVAQLQLQLEAMKQQQRPDQLRNLENEIGILKSKQAAPTPPIVHHYYYPPRQVLPIDPEPKQKLPIDPEPKQILPIDPEPKQKLPIDPKPKQELPIDPKPKQDLIPDPKPKQELMPEPKSIQPMLPASPQTGPPKGYQRFTVPIAQLAPLNVGPPGSMAKPSANYVWWRDRSGARRLTLYRDRVPVGAWWDDDHNYYPWHEQTKSWGDAATLPVPLPQQSTVSVH